MLRQSTTVGLLVVVTMFGSLLVTESAEAGRRRGLLHRLLHRRQPACRTTCPKEVRIGGYCRTQFIEEIVGPGGTCLFRVFEAHDSTDCGGLAMYSMEPCDATVEGCPCNGSREAGKTVNEKWGRLLVRTQVDPIQKDYIPKVKFGNLELVPFGQHAYSVRLPGESTDRHFKFYKLKKRNQPASYFGIAIQTAEEGNPNVNWHVREVQDSSSMYLATKRPNTLNAPRFLLIKGKG